MCALRGYNARGHDHAMDARDYGLCQLIEYPYSYFLYVLTQKQTPTRALMFHIL